MYRWKWWFRNQGLPNHYTQQHWKKYLFSLFILTTDNVYSLNGKWLYFLNFFPSSLWIMHAKYCFFGKPTSHVSFPVLILYTEYTFLILS